MTVTLITIEVARDKVKQWSGSVVAWLDYFSEADDVSNFNRKNFVRVSCASDNGYCAALSFDELTVVVTF